MKHTVAKKKSKGTKLSNASRAKRVSRYIKQLETVHPDTGTIALHVLHLERVCFKRLEVYVPKKTFKVARITYRKGEVLHYDLPDSIRTSSDAIKYTTDCEGKSYLDQCTVALVECVEGTEGTARTFTVGIERTQVTTARIDTQATIYAKAVDAVLRSADKLDSLDFAMSDVYSKYKVINE